MLQELSLFSGNSGVAQIETSDAENSVIPFVEGFANLNKQRSFNLGIINSETCNNYF